MRKVVFATLVVVLALASHAAWAIELIPFAGYRWGGGMTTISGIRKFDTEDTYSYGGAIGASFPGSSAEIYWGHFNGKLFATTTGGQQITGEVTRDDIMLTGLWYAGSGLNAMRPYFSLGLGASVFGSPRSETVGRFAWSLGVGIRREMGERLAIRVDGRWLPTWVTTGSGVWCDYYYGCYTAGTGEYYDQWETSLGVILKLGSSNY
jgi:hypothetical protein